MLPYSSPSHRQLPDSFASQAGTQQPFAYQRRASNSSASGLQSPPYDDHDNFDATLPTDELKSALFGPASSIRPHAQTAGLVAASDYSYGGYPSAAAVIAAQPASFGQLQQQVQQQLQSTKMEYSPRCVGFESAGIPAHHQRASESSSGFVGRQQDAPHSTRQWSIPVASPKLANEFSLHSNPLAEQFSEEQLPSLSTKSVDSKSHAKHQQAQLPEQENRHVLSLSELACMDPSSL